MKIKMETEITGTIGTEPLEVSTEPTTDEIMNILLGVTE